MQSTFSSNICIDMNVLRLNQHFCLFHSSSERARAHDAIKRCNFAFNKLQSLNDLFDDGINCCAERLWADWFMAEIRNSKHDRLAQITSLSLDKWMSVFRAAKCCAIITQFRVASGARPFHVQPTDEVKFQWSSIDGVIDESSTSAARSASITNFARESFAGFRFFSNYTTQHSIIFTSRLMFA